MMSGPSSQGRQEVDDGTTAVRNGGISGRDERPVGELFQRLNSVTRDRSMLAGLGMRTADDVFEQLQKAYSGDIEKKHRRRQRGTEEIDGAGQKRSKRRRTVMGEEMGHEEEQRIDERQQEAAVQSVLGSLDEEFVERERRSTGYRWCEAIPESRKI